MKSATIPPLRVTPALRQEAGSVLRDGESLSGFVEDSLRRHIEYRKIQGEFIARGLVSHDAARATGHYAGKDEVMESLRSKLEATRSQE